jgi:hypothetical protein
MAVSHVWSHGQGGRPDKSGLNQCLHQRYCRIAESQGCDSYWMDTPCISSDHKLRQEAIGRINDIFETSKLTIACDRDLMEIDISELSIEMYEQLPAAILLCDWNVRAWKLLEGMRGRKNLHFLCKDDRFVAFHEIAEQVYRHGRLDLSALLSEIQHLIRPAKFNQAREDYRGWKSATVPHDEHDVAAGIVEVYGAAALLSQRHASRNNDDVIIWSLLCSRTPYSSPEDLWMKQLLVEKSSTSSQALVPTGFLMSSIPRVTGVKFTGRLEKAYRVYLSTGMATAIQNSPLYISNHLPY